MCPSFSQSLTHCSVFCVFFYLLCQLFRFCIQHVLVFWGFSGENLYLWKVDGGQNTSFLGTQLAQHWHLVRQIRLVQIWTFQYYRIKDIRQLLQSYESGSLYSTLEEHGLCIVSDPAVKKINTKYVPGLTFNRKIPIRIPDPGKNRRWGFKGVYPDSQLLWIIKV